jgi:hypothetical protein
MLCMYMYYILFEHYIFSVLFLSSVFPILIRNKLGNAYIMHQFLCTCSFYLITSISKSVRLAEKVYLP